MWDTNIFDVVRNDVYFRWNGTKLIQKTITEEKHVRQNTYYRKQITGIILGEIEGKTGKPNRFNLQKQIGP